MTLHPWSLSIQIGTETPYDIDLSALAAQRPDGVVTLGRASGDGCAWQIPVASPIVTGSHAHGLLQWHQEGEYWTYLDNNSANGTFINGVHYRAGGSAGQQPPRPVRLEDGDRMRIDLPEDAERHNNGVMLMLRTGRPSRYECFDLRSRPATTIGAKGDIRLSSINAQDVQATITGAGGQYVINFTSRYGGFINGQAPQPNHVLKDREHLYIAGTQFQYSNGFLYMREEAVSYGGVMLRVRNLTRTSRGKLDHVSFDVHKGEMIGVVGSSGAGKSTLLNAISGNVAPESGTVLYNGIDLIHHHNVLKNSIGFVPQQDIMHDKLRVGEMLEFSARLRLLDSVGAAERRQRVDQVIQQLGLTQQRNTTLDRVSGGQKKRANIGIEMLSDPDLFFLDEPTSGLDPGTEKNLMVTLRQVAETGKAVVLITHSTLALPMCDKIIIIGRDGKMTYFGKPEGALEFFQVEQFADIFDKITQAKDADVWKERFNSIRRDVIPSDAQEAPAEKAPREKVKKTHFSPLRQTATLTARYFRLIFRNKGWLLGMIAVIPLAAVYIVGGLMASDKTLVYYSDTYKVQFTLICIAAFAGLMTAYNEICKERDVFEREASANLHISSYLLSKVTVLSCISLVQSVIMTAGFYWGVGDPGTSLLMPGYIEIGLTIFLTILSASCLGLLISAVFKTGESAAQPLIIVLIMQVVLSGAIMPLSGVTRTLANVICSFWGTNALSASTGLSNLPMEAIDANGFAYTPDIPGYDYLAATEENLLTSLIWLAGISVVSILLAFASLKWRKQLEAVAGALRPRRK